MNEADQAKIAPTLIETSDVALAALLTYGKGRLCDDPPFNIIRKADRQAIEFRVLTTEPQLVDDFRRNAEVSVRVRDYEECRRHLLGICKNVLRTTQP